MVVKLPSICSLDKHTQYKFITHYSPQQLWEKKRKCVCVKQGAQFPFWTIQLSMHQHRVTQLLGNSGIILCLDLRPHQCMEYQDHRSSPFESRWSVSSWSEWRRHHWARSTWIVQHRSCGLVWTPHCFSDVSCFWLSVPGRAVSEGTQVSAPPTSASSSLVEGKQKRLHLFEFEFFFVLVHSPEEGDGTLPLYWPSESTLSRSSRLSELMDDDESRLSSEVSCSSSGNLQAKFTLKRTRCSI